MSRKILILIFLSLTCWSVWGQEFGITGSRLFSSNYELEDPYGFGILLAFPSNSSIKIKFEYNDHRHTRYYFGSLVGGFLVRPPEEESVESRSKTHCYEISLNKSLVRSAKLNIYLSLGLHSNTFEVTREGLETGKVIELTPESKWGYLLAIQPEILLLKNIPLNFYGTIKFKQFFTSSIILDAENPFDESFDLSEIQLGFLVKI